MFQRLDLVRLINGSEMIVIDVVPSRPVNPYVGVKPRGNGARYKFGPKFNPVKIGTVTESHPAVAATVARVGGITPQLKKNLQDLFNVVDEGDIHKARSIADICRSLLSMATQSERLWDNGEPVYQPLLSQGISYRDPIDRELLAAGGWFRGTTDDPWQDEISREEVAALLAVDVRTVIEWENATDLECEAESRTDDFGW